MESSRLKPRSRKLKRMVAILAISVVCMLAPSAHSSESLEIAKVTVYPLVKEGYEQLQKGSYLEAVDTLCEAVILDRDDISARRYLAIALIKSDNADRALEQMGLVGRLTPPSAFDYFIYGEAYVALGKYKEAEESYRKSLDKDPQSDTAQAGIIKSLVGALEWDKAITECQKCLKQATTKEQKVYFQKLLKKVKEAKEKPPTDGDEEPPVVPAPSPSQTSAGSNANTSLPVTAIPVSSPPSQIAPAASISPALPPTTTPAQTAPQSAQPASKIPIATPKTSMPSMQGTLP